MALIKCEECGYWFSNGEKSCPNCGCPVDEPCPPKPPRKGGKRALYVVLGIVLIVGVASVIAFMYNDMAKREQEAKKQAEMLRLELRERQKTDSIATVRAQEEALCKAREDSIEAAIAYENQQRIEETEQLRQEGIQRTIRINCSMEENGYYTYSSNICSYNYGHVGDAVISTKIYRIPKGKVWLYKGYYRCEEMKNTHPTYTHPFLEYFSKENEGWRDRDGQHYHHDQDIRLDHGGVPVLRPGDGVAIRQYFDKRYPGDYWIEVYFVEKDEEAYY